MNKSTTRDLILSAFFVALGVAIPQFFHMVDAGKIFLPMHIPILLCAFFVDWKYALAVGAVTPILSSFLTGMPPLFPVLCYMLPELMTYGLVTCLLRKRFPMFVSLLGGMVAGRLVSGLAVWVLTTFFMVKLPNPFVFLWGALAAGIPGIIIQLILIPVIVFSVSKVKSHGTA